MSKYYNYIFPLVLVIILSIIALIFGFNGLYGQDSHDYLHFTRDLKAGLPISHYLHPIGYPFFGFLFSKYLFIPDIFSMQLISIVSLSLLFVYLRKPLILLYNSKEKINVYLILFFILSPYMLRFSILIMSDMLCAFFCLASFYYALRYSRTENIKYIILVILLSVLASETRYAAIIILLPTIILILKTIFMKSKYFHIILAFVFISILLLPDFLLRGRILFIDFNNANQNYFNSINSSLWSIGNLFKNSFSNSDGIENYNLINILYAFITLFHPAFLFAGLILILFIKKVDFVRLEFKLIIGMIFLYLIFLAGLQYQNKRFFIIIFPFIILLFYPAFIRITDKLILNKIRTPWVFSFIVILQLTFFFLSIKPIYILNQTELKTANFLKKYKDSTIYTCSIDIALQTYISNKIINLYNNNVTIPEKNSLLLYNKAEFTEHWGTYHPDKTFENLKANFSLNKLASLPQEWELYEIR
jgi:hypothetical protein